MSGRLEAPACIDFTRSCMHSENYRQLSDFHVPFVTLAKFLSHYINLLNQRVSKEDLSSGNDYISYYSGDVNSPNSVAYTVYGTHHEYIIS